MEEVLTYLASRHRGDLIELVAQSVDHKTLCLSFFTRPLLGIPQRPTWLNIKNGAALVQAQQHSIESAKNKIRSVEYGKDMGFRMVNDKLDAQQKYFESLRDLSESKYRSLTALLDRQSISVYSRSEPLRPGIALDADFLVDKSNLYEWVLEPLYALGHNISL